MTSSRRVREVVAHGLPYSTIDGGVLSIDPLKLPRDPFAACAPVYPWTFIRTNTIYGVIHRAHGRTVRAGKHAVYAAVSGPTGTSNASNVDDYYSPDVNSDVIPPPGISVGQKLIRRNEKGPENRALLGAGAEAGI